MASKLQFADPHIQPKGMSSLHIPLARASPTSPPRYRVSGDVVILEPQEIKSDTVSTVSPSISHEVMGPDAMIYTQEQFKGLTTYHSTNMYMIL